MCARALLENSSGYVIHILSRAENSFEERSQVNNLGQVLKSCRAGMSTLRKPEVP